MIAYLTKVEIDYETAVKRGLRDSYAWHQKVWQAFPDRDKKERNFLTRVDDTNDGFRLLILSRTIPIRPDWCPTDSWNTSEIADSFLANTQFQFSLLANATEKKVVRDEHGVRKKNGRRKALTREEDLRSWMQRKAAQHGFTIADSQLRVTPMPKQFFLKKGKLGTHVATRFDGILSVTDKEAFTKALTTGIGPAKAFGFGMLCISPLST